LDEFCITFLKSEYLSNFNNFNGFKDKPFITPQLPRRKTLVRSHSSQDKRYQETFLKKSCDFSFKKSIVNTAAV